MIKFYLLFNIIILYSSEPSSTTCLNASKLGAPESTAARQAGSPSWDITKS